MNPATAFAEAVADELVRSGVTEAVLAPGSRSAPLALALLRRAQAGDLRLHVRIDERSAGFLALGLAKASRRPVPVLCTSGTAAAHLHAAVIEADEAGVPLLVLTADRPPELRGTGASQAIDQLKLYGSAVRWFAEAGVPEDRPGAAGYWRSLACKAWAMAAGTAGGFPGPVHLNLPLRDPLVPVDGSLGDPAGPAGGTAAGPGPGEWPAWLAGRPGGAPWTSFGPQNPAGGAGPAAADGADGADEAGWADVDWAERGVLVCGDGDLAAGPLLRLAAAAGWPVLAEPSSGARQGPNALTAYSYLLADPGFAAAHRPEVIVSAGRPGLSRGQLAFLRAAAGQDGGPPARHYVVAQGPGRWADPGRSASAVVPGVRLRGGPGPGTPPGTWLAAWQRADAAVRAAVTAEVDRDSGISEPWLARELAAALPDGALLWAASSMPVRDLDQQAAPRSGLRVLASRGTSGIDGLVSASIGAALAHQAAGGAGLGAARRRGVPARRAGADARPARAPPGPVPGRGQQQRRRDLQHAGAGRPAGASLRAAVRHAARGRPCGGCPGRQDPVRHHQDPHGPARRPDRSWPARGRGADRPGRRDRAAGGDDRRGPQRAPAVS